MRSNERKPGAGRQSRRPSLKRGLGRLPSWVARWDRGRTGRAPKALSARTRLLNAFISGLTAVEPLFNRSAAEEAEGGTA